MQPSIEMGCYSFDGRQERRMVNPTMTISFTAVSWSRWKDDTYIHGEDEAMELRVGYRAFPAQARTTSMQQDLLW